MAKDDYYVIVYQILSYLYSQLKKGKDIEPEKLLHDGTLFNINYDYWVYIMVNMLEQGFIKGVNNANVGNGYYIVQQLKDIRITPKGIEYLCENSFIEKAKQFLKDVKEITPFI